MHSAQICVRLRARPGDLLACEGSGTLLQLTAVGEREVLAKGLAEKGFRFSAPVETLWTLAGRDWKKVSAEQAEGLVREGLG
ncbi:MAG: hypothetical protein KKE73_08250 [Proteobacteria bacterium]|nr:hypothetical protein [Pseudomonadota bacterium]